MFLHITPLFKDFDFLGLFLSIVPIVLFLPTFNKKSSDES